jgi:hypothetical protein
VAGFGAVAKDTPDLMEWDYRDYGGRLTSDIRRERQAGICFATTARAMDSLRAVCACSDIEIAPLRILFRYVDPAARAARS